MGTINKRISRFEVTAVFAHPGASVDIVLVHGLNGHPQKTWTAEGNGVFWPADLLPASLNKQCANVLVYGYNADVYSTRNDGSASSNFIHEHAQTLVATLSNHRRSEETTRNPIIWVAHSLGGILVKRALLYSNDVRSIDHEPLRSIYVSTYGIIFLGTPHTGADLATWGTVLQAMSDAVVPKRFLDTEPVLLHALKRDNETLQNINSHFLDIHQRFKIHMAHENQKTDIKGHKVMVVDVNSASPQLPGVTYYGIEATHSGMCKFESVNAPGYRILSTTLRDWVADAIPIIESRWDFEEKERRARAEHESSERMIRYGGISVKSAHLPPERLETPPQPLATIPFSRDTDFGDRGDILDQLRQRCSEPAGRVALVGLGGIGKSQLAIEFAHRAAEETPNRWIFWIHAGTQARVEEGFRAIADAVKLPGRNQPKADIPQLVYSWLSNERNGRWTIIIDSADDVDVFFVASHGRGGKILADCLPQSRNGSIVVTTRNRDLANRLTGSHKNTIGVGPMALADALILLEKKLGPFSDVAIAKDLVQALDHVPLAISQAAAYIQARSPMSSIEKYLAEFRKGECNRAQLLGNDAGEFRREGGASNAILTTWQISFEHIRSRRPSAADLLAFMSFFDRQGIALSLLRPVNAQGVPRDSGSESDDDDDDEADDGFEDDVAILRDFCFVATNEDGSALEMHGLVQLSTRKWLEADGLQNKFKQQFIERMAAAFPTGDYSNWANCRQLFAHVEAAADHGPDEEKMDEWSSLMHNGGYYAWSQGRYEVAERMMGKARRSRKKRFGEEDERTLASISLLALVFMYKGLWAKAEPLGVQVVETCKIVLGEEHPLTLTSMANLASAYRNQGRWKEAEKLQEKEYKICSKVLGEEHPDTLTSMGNLASTYSDQGRWKEAESLEVQVMETEKRVLGEEHPSTLTSMANLAFTWMDQGRHADALALMKECAQARQQILGPDHPNTLSSLSAVADWSS